MTLERGMVLPRTISKLSLDEPCLTTTMAEYEDSVMSHLAKIIQSDQHSVVITSAKLVEWSFLFLILVSFKTSLPRIISEFFARPSKTSLTVWRNQVWRRETNISVTNVKC